MAARALEKLSAVAVRNTNKPGMYGDGGVMAACRTWRAG